MTGPLFDPGWIVANLDAIALAAVQHIWLTGLAVTAGFAISFAMALAIRARRGLDGPITGLAGVLYTIPSLALFAALVPVTGLSLLTALIPLTIYTLLILVRGTVAGFAAVPADVREAALGMGFSSGALFRRVELPLAVPLMVAGLRLATVSTIGLVTVASTLGDAFGGLGVLINSGLQTFFFTKVYVGAGLSVLLAIGADLLFVSVERRVTRWSQAGRDQAPAGRTGGRSTPPSSVAT